MTVSTSAPLAIVIPAYKAQFLREALASIAAQTNRRFNIYVGDDASPEPVAEIVREFSGTLPIQYHRFDKNLGGTSLVRQWERCLRLSTEPWVWLFGDDDCMEPDCVAAFLAELENTNGRHDLYRFNTVWINEDGSITQQSPPHPSEETGADFLRARLQQKRNSTLQELIFPRHAWEAGGGIPDFPLAWAADDAFIARLGAERMIKTISGPRVRWRLSGVNISNSGASATLDRKIEASAEFVRWTVAYFNQFAPNQKSDAVSLTEQWFLSYVSHMEKFLGGRVRQDIERLFSETWGKPADAGRRWVFEVNRRVALQKFKRLVTGRK